MSTNRFTLLRRDNPLPRRKTHPEDRRLWSKVALSPELADIMAFLLAARRLPPGEAHQVILEAIRLGMPDEYKQAVAMLAKFNHADDPPPE